MTEIEHQPKVAANVLSQVISNNRKELDLSSHFQHIVSIFLSHLKELHDHEGFISTTLACVA